MMDSFQQEALLNLIFCVAIVVLAVLQYRHSKTMLPIYLGVSFALFVASYFIVFIGQSVGNEMTLLILRTVAYLIIIVSLVQSYSSLASEKKK